MNERIETVDFNAPRGGFVCIIPGGAFHPTLTIS